LSLSASHHPSAPELVLDEGTMLAKKYRLLRPAGFGGMAQLWAAKNEATGAEVCIKVLVPERMDDEPVKRFRREAHAAARLSHRAIVRTFDLLELAATGEVATGKTPAVALGLVMELLQGETLGDLLAKKGALSLDDTLDIALPVCSALAHAHRAGIVHRDLKPDNIFLATDPDGEALPKVLDFGISKVSSGSGNTLALTQDGVMLGTPAFMSPEQAKGAKSIDARSDVFSMGIMIYVMLSGKNPFDGSRLHDILTSILENEPARIADVPDEVWSVIHKALMKDPSHRYADANDLGNALSKAAGRDRLSDPMIPIAAHDGRPSSASNVPVVAAVEEAHDEVPGPPKRPVKLVVGILGGAAVILVAAGIRVAVSGSDDSGSHPLPTTTTTVSTPPPPTATLTATWTATLTATAPPTETAPPSATAPAETAAATATETATTAAPHVTAVPTARVVPTTTAPAAVATTLDDPKPTPPPRKTAEPAKTGGSIIRDPGF
jgi:serine/threonine-protein kinase